MFNLIPVHIILIGALLVATSASAAIEMDSKLRLQVDTLKAEFADQRTNAANAHERALLLRDWIDAYALAGGYIPVNATAVIQSSMAYGVPAYDQLDALIAELALRDDDSRAIGELELSNPGPHLANHFSQFSQTYTVGTKPIKPGGGLLISRHFQTNPGLWQTQDPDRDNYISIKSSNPQARFHVDNYPVSGMHGGFRGAENQLVFRLADAELRLGDIVTVTYGDRTAGSRGLRMPDFASDAMPFPLYVDLDGSNLWYSLPIQPVQIVGATVAGVHGFAPSIVAAGKPFSFSIRAEDAFANRATGPIPAWRVSINGEFLRDLPAGNEAIQVIDDIVLENPGVYRVSIESRDGAIKGVANPIVVKDNPKQFVYWGDTHGHSGFAEGIGTAEEFMRFARDDSRLDFVTHSEHDLWMDAREWQHLKTLVRKYHEEGRFIPYLGYEWTIASPQGGHHNVLFRTPEGREMIPGALFPTLSRLYQGLKENYDPRDIVVIPHAHNPGDYRQSDPELEPLVEISSMHGNFEWFGRMYLKHGHQVGFVAASDDHLAKPGYSIPWRASLAQKGGLAGVIAEERSNDAIFGAMRNLSTYATTGDRMVLNFSVNDGSMGQRIPFKQDRLVKGSVVGTTSIRSIDVLKNDEVIWSKNYGVDKAYAIVPDQDTHLTLSFGSHSHPGEVSDSPRGWRHWAGTIEVKGANLIAAELVDAHNRNYQALEQNPKNPAMLRLATMSRGDHSSVSLTLRNANENTHLILRLSETTETGSAPPRLRSHQTIPGNELILRLADLNQGQYSHHLPVDKFTDSVTLTLTNLRAPKEAEFQFEDDTPAGHGDYYFMRVRQTNEALGWSSPIWVGGHPPR